MTAAVTLGPSPAPTFRPRPGDEDRVVTVFANLMPGEVVDARRLRALQRRLVVGLAALVVLLIGAYGLSWWQTAGAQDDLASEQSQTTVLNSQLAKYGPLLAAQSQASSINATLQTLMANDLSWRNLIGNLQKTAAGNVTITGIAGTVDDPSTGAAAGASTDGTAGGQALLNEGRSTLVGTVTISGNATDTRAIAGFVERLGAVPGVTAPLPSSVSGDSGKLTFSIIALITNKALGGRFSAPAPGGK